MLNIVNTVDTVNIVYVVNIDNIIINVASAFQRLYIDEGGTGPALANP